MTNASKIIELPKIIDERGNLSLIEARKHIPFNIKRAYWIYDIPGGQERGSHAYKEQEEIIIALSGSFDIELDDGKSQQVYSLNRSYKALYIQKLTWRTLKNFSTNALCLVVSSHPYNEEDYIRDYALFQKIAKENKDLSNIVEQEKTSTENKEGYATIYDCSLIEFPQIRNRAGNLTPVHSSSTIPFDIERLFYIYDIPSGATRGMHAHRFCHEVLVAASGSFEVELDDGRNKRIILLNSPKYGLHIPPGVWATEKNYSSGAICIALASEHYNDKSYIHSYEDFIKYRSHGSKNI